MDTIIDFQNVGFAYESSEEGQTPIPVLHDINLNIRRGELIAILGHNGSGKSTLCKMTNGILLPKTGRVLVDGMDTADEQRQLDIRQRVGLVFQNPDNQIVATVVEEDVAFALENLGVPHEDIRGRVDSALQAVGMYEYREHAPHRLSGGQKQRVAIAGVLAMEPLVLVLDEPTAMLDPVGREEVMKAVIGLCRDKGVTVLMITHHMNEAALFDRVLVMHKGRLMMDAAPEDIFLQADILRDYGLTVPQTVEIARLAGVTDKAPLTVEDCAQAIYNQIAGNG